jgi:hypothetical protein
MPRGRPKNLSDYEQRKIKKIRAVLSDNKISRFDKFHDAALLKILHVDSTGNVFISYDFFNERLDEIGKRVMKSIQE